MQMFVCSSALIPPPDPEVHNFVDQHKVGSTVQLKNVNLRQQTNAKPSKDLLFSKKRAVQNYLVCGKNLCSVF